MPIDRTVCPNCLGHASQAGACRMCSGSGSVCPTCRGGRYVRRESATIHVTTCPDCTDNADGFTAGGLPLYQRNLMREAQTIRRSRDQQVFAPAGGVDDDDDIPF